MQLKTNPKYSSIVKEKEELIKNIKTSSLSYFKSNSYPIEVIKEVVDEDFIASNPSYYLYYPYLYSDYFQIKDKEILNLLSISGFLYYKAIILIDDIFDNKGSENNFQKYFIANICQEETIKILSSFFSANTDFWATWNVRKFEYAKAYNLDENLKNIKAFSEFEALADYKSAFGKIAIDCLYHLSNKKGKSMYKALLESHKFFYVGFQIMDDIIDYSEDVKNEQFNISKQELINVLNKDSDDIESYSLEEQRKLVYLKGVAENLYVKATKYLNKSSELQGDFKNNDNNLWVNEINNLYNTGLTHFLNIKGFINVHNSEKKLSQTLKSQLSLNETIKKGIEYIELKQMLDGSWNDIFNDAGVSDVWTTSYVTYSLNKLLPKIKVNNAKDYITKCQSPTGLWGYNKIWVDDADSSSFAILSLKSKGSTVNDYINKWLKFQNKDGGFTTYNDENVLLSSLNSPYIQDVGGWLQSHFCVSAVAFLVFIEQDIIHKNEFERLRDYLIEKLKSNSSSLSYWWSKDIYAIYFILLGAIKTNDIQIINLCEVRVEILVKQEKDLNYFFKGFLLKTLCLKDNLFNKYSKEIKKITSQISSNQFEGGSWKESYSLRMPHPSALNLDNENIAWNQGSKGTNIIVKDYNRIFTTISCVTALKIYESRI